MRPELPPGPWEHIGILGPSRIEGLLFSQATESLVAVTCQRLAAGMEVRRLYYRRLPEELYRPVSVRHPLESQVDAVCCGNAPVLLFNEMRFCEPKPKSWYPSELLKGQHEPPVGHGADWLGVRRIDLRTGKDETVLDERTISPPPPFVGGWVSRLMSVSTDGSSAICQVGLDLGGQMRYFVCEVGLPGGLKRTIAELPNVFA
jgi:hypothetical protein